MTKFDLSICFVVLESTKSLLEWWLTMQILASSKKQPKSIMREKVGGPQQEIKCPKGSKRGDHGEPISFYS